MKHVHCLFNKSLLCRKYDKLLFIHLPTILFHASDLRPSGFCWNCTSDVAYWRVIILFSQESKSPRPFRDQDYDTQGKYEKQHEQGLLGSGDKSFQQHAFKEWRGKGNPAPAAVNIKWIGQEQCKLFSRAPTLCGAECPELPFPSNESSECPEPHRH